MYNKFYFLHVPKTGGRFLKKYIIDPIKEELSNNGIDLIKNPQITPDKPISGLHAGWNWNIDPNTYIVSCFRNPVEWACSYFVHNKYLDMQLLDLDNEGILIEQKKIDVSGSDVIEWLNKNKFLQNYQSKNFIIGVQKDSTIRRDIIINDLMGETINLDLLFRRLKRVNLLFRQSDLKKMDYNVLIQKISSDMGIEIYHRVSGKESRQYYSHDASKVLYDSLSNFERDSIEDLMSIDMKVYNDSSLFWSSN